MANEARTTIKFDYLESNVFIRTNPTRIFPVATTSDILSDSTQIVGTTHELIAAGDVTDDAMAIVENLHATALVRIGGDAAAAFVPWIEIPAGGPPAILPVVATLASTYLISSVASTSVRVTLVKIVAPV